MRLFLTLVAMVIFGSSAFAGPIRDNIQARRDARHGVSRYEHNASTTTKSVVTPTGTTTKTTSVESTKASGVYAASAMAEVNAARAARGLPPYVEDPALAAGAQACAAFRAANRIKGHTANDFAFLPPGTLASAGGSGALAPSWGWASCCTYESWTYAGAAVVMGRDGKRYMQLFVR